MKNSNANMPHPPAGSPENVTPAVSTAHKSPLSPAPPLAEAGKERPDHATRFRKGVSGNPKGRPVRSLNKSTLEANAVLAANARQLTHHAIQMALKGSPTALRLCFERILPAKLNRRFRKTSTQDFLSTYNDLIAAVAEGQLTSLEAKAIAKLQARAQSPFGALSK